MVVARADRETGKRLFGGLVWFLLVALWLLAAPLAAQENGKVIFDFQAWEKTAARAEEIIKSAEASSSALETLRATLADYRSKALALQEASQARINTLQSQLDALGPPPAKGEVEAPEVARRRAELIDQLAQARAPVLAAQEARTRADGLIGEIDRIIRERLADQLFTLGPTPLNPARWPEGLAAIARLSDDIAGEVSEGLQSDAQRVMTTQNLPLTLALVILGLLLITRARRWLLRALGFVPRSRRDAPNEARALLLSTTQVIMPMLGLWAILKGIDATGLVGLRGEVVLSAVPAMGLALFGAAWLGRTLFSRMDDTPLFFWFSDTEALRARRTAILMGVVLALYFLLRRLATQADFTEVARVVLSFPVVLAGGLALLRMGILLDPPRGEDSPLAGNPVQKRLYRIISRGTMVIGVGGPILAAVGYFTAANAFVFPAILTLALLGTIMVLFRLGVRLAEVLSPVPTEPDDRAEGESPLTLFPVVLGFFLIMLALPLLALIWGARVSDLLEIWRLVSDGFTIGGRRISVTDFLTFAVVFAIGYTVTRLMQGALRNTVLPRTRLDAGGRNAIITGTGYVGITLSALAAITSAGLDLSSLAIVAGALSVGIGFGLQAVVSNFVSGLILLVERPIKEGDWIEVGQYSGYVRKISVRSTEIQTFDRATVIVPNADLISGTVTNWTHSNMNGRVKVPIGVAYGSDPEKVREILLEIAEAHPMRDHRSKPGVVFMGFGPDSMDFEIRVIIKDVNNVLSVRSDLNFEIVRRFDEEGIEIPFAQRDIHLRNLDELGETLGQVVARGKHTKEDKA